MQKFFLSLVAFAFSLVISAQGHGNSKGEDKSNGGKSATQGNNNSKNIKATETKAGNDHNKNVWEGTSDRYGNSPRPSKNQPAKVLAAFQKEYPYASNVSWSKYRGDWIANFRNGPFMSTALYHA